MSKTDVQQQSINSCRDCLLKSIMQASERMDIGRTNEVKASTIDTELQNFIRARDNLREVVNHMVDMYKNIKNYADKRKELAMDALKLAISKAGYIVPDADIEGIHLNVDNKKASIVDAEGSDINLKEGSAYRTVMSMLVRYTLTKEQPDAIQAIFLDEAFGTLSDETITLMREYLTVFKDDILIVGIEQHDTLFQGLGAVEIQAIKGQDGITTIIQE